MGDVEELKIYQHLAEKVEVTIFCMFFGDF